MKLETLKNKKILIVGFGVEGKAAHAYVARHFPESIIAVADKNTDGVGYLDKQKEYDIAIKTPSVPKENLTITYTTTMNIFMANAKGKVIGITGTKGKSTTTSLIYEMLLKEHKNVYLGGNIGNSPLEFLDTLNEQSWTVLELSSFQLQDLKYSPHIAVLLMITQEHIDYHKSFEEYLSAKRNILRFQKSTDFAILNRDYPPSNESDILTDATVFHVSRERACDKGCFIQDQKVKIKDQKSENNIIDVEDIKLLGKHNLENVCAAVMAATLAGVSKQNITSVLQSFKGLPHRLEFVGQKNDIEFYNDSLATVPQATIEALEALPDTETLIAGGHDRGIDYADLGEYLVKTQVKTLILFPTTGEKIWEAVCKAMSEASRPEKFDVTTMGQAVRIAASETSPGKICLLSPAAASFGIFKDYKDRGEQFKKAIENLA